MKSRKLTVADLNFVQRLFLKTYCFPPPGRFSAEEDAQVGNWNPGKDALERFHECFGSGFAEAIRGKCVADIGCGDGKQVIALAQQGAARAVGVELRPLFAPAQAFAAAHGLADRVQFHLVDSTPPAPGSADVAISHNSFEHLTEPQVVLAATRALLKPGGRMFVTFSPPWLHPFGVHMFFMIKYPWAHLLWSEKTILKVRSLYRDDHPARYEDVDGGLNKMTIRRFEREVRKGGFTMQRMVLRPIRPLPGLITRLPFVREFFTSTVAAELRAP